MKPSVLFGGLGAVLVLGPALVAGSLLQPARQPSGAAASGPTPSPSARPVNEKLQAAASSTYKPQPTPNRLAAHTSSELVANLAADPDYKRFIATLTTGP